jgi:hypothetical protein
MKWKPLLGWENLKMESKQMGDTCFLKFGNTVKTGNFSCNVATDDFCKVKIVSSISINFSKFGFPVVLVNLYFNKFVQSSGSVLFWSFCIVPRSLCIHKIHLSKGGPNCVPGLTYFLSNLLNLLLCFKGVLFFPLIWNAYYWLPSLQNRINMYAHLCTQFFILFSNFVFQSFIIIFQRQATGNSVSCQEYLDMWWLAEKKGNDILFRQFVQRVS